MSKPLNREQLGRLPPNFANSLQIPSVRLWAQLFFCCIACRSTILFWKSKNGKNRYSNGVSTSLARNQSAASRDLSPSHVKLRWHFLCLGIYRLQIMKMFCLNQIFLHVVLSASLVINMVPFSILCNQWFWRICKTVTQPSDIIT